MKNDDLILDKEMKILLIEILKRGVLTRNEAVKMTEKFELILTPEQIDRAIDKL